MYALRPFVGTSSFLESSFTVDSLEQPAIIACYLVPHHGLPFIKRLYCVSAFLVLRRLGERSNLQQNIEDENPGQDHIVEEQKNFSP